MSNLVVSGEASGEVSDEDTVRFFQERQERVDMARFREILDRPGGEPPRAGDELPAAS